MSIRFLCLVFLCVSSGRPDEAVEVTEYIAKVTRLLETVQAYSAYADLRNKDNPRIVVSCASLDRDGIEPPNAFKVQRLVADAVDLYIVHD